ncbi:MAG: phosphoribosylformylglycinamidine synthase subunit PurQ [Candidatus Omnitrophica bacterium]|nr:phosphoribosylformylglycinamidine synthase subunit PurQ [Candidatus Omnitrophota bacterium]
MKKCKVIVFPGSNCDADCFHVMDSVFKLDVEYAWHKDMSLGTCDFIILPGGFSYGDYLRCGSIARFSPIMNDVIDYAKKGKPIIGICNGFQILLEVGLLPGAMLRNKTLQFICKSVFLKTENCSTMFTNAIPRNAILSVPIAHGEGNYYCDNETMKELQEEERIIFKYCSEDGTVSDESNPNGSLEAIAGICNTQGNVLGMMPHPERVSEGILGSDNGAMIFQSIINTLS